MTTLFRDMRKNFMHNGKLQKYMLYSAGEILLIVVGILLALQVNNWNEGRKQKKEEKKVLQEIKEGIELDRIDIQGNIGAYSSSLQSIQILLQAIREDRSYHDSLSTHFSNSLIRTVLTSNEGNFDVLKMKGYDLISSNQLRQKIITLYDNRYDLIQEVQNGIYVSNDRLSDYSLHHFDRVVGITYDETTKKSQPGKMVPTDFGNLKKDPYYRSLLNSRQENCIFRIVQCEKTITLMDVLLDDLNYELSK